MLWATVAGGDGRGLALLVVPTDEPDQGTCSSMLSAPRAALRRDLFASEPLLKMHAMGLYAPNATL